jgi:hypothetical protein
VEDLIGLPGAHLFALLLGLAMVGCGVVHCISERLFGARAGRATGRVVAIDEEPGMDGPTWYPVVRFTPPGGRTVEFRCSVGTYTRWYRVGQPVTVLFDPRSPDRAKIASFLNRYFVAINFGCFGVGAVFVGLFPLLCSGG